MRIISLLPAATEIVAALGLLDHLVGVSHECDYPEPVNDLPRVMTCPIYKAGLTSAEIDEAVRESTAKGESLYRIDVDLMQRLQPDLVLTQMLCDVCAIGYGTVAGAIASLNPRPRLLNLEPRWLEDLYQNIRDVAAVVDEISTVPLDAAARAEACIESLRNRVDAVVRGVASVDKRPRVLFLEWIDPPFAAGHWTPELIALAGGECVLGEPGIPSQTREWSEVAASNPDVLIVSCCGYDVDMIERDMAILADKPFWRDWPAVRGGRVYIVDGSQYFNRPGPRLIDSLEILAAAFHPELFPNSDFRAQLRTPSAPVAQ
jgi:iron complex transport system substrate-binding protein